MIDRLLAQMQAMQMLSKAQEVTADNLANINTPGFKGNKLFYRMMTEQVDGREVARTVPMQQVNTEQGVLEPTGNAFDFGINGEGFFMIEEDGSRFLSRDGRFHLDSEGYLKNSQGGKVLGSSGAIHIPEFFHATGQDEGSAKLEVAKDGTIRLNDKVHDKFRIVQVNDPANLERRGNSYFAASGNAQLTDAENSTVMQGFYEKGNVEPLQEMVDMMRTMQMFEAQQRAMRTTDETLSQATSSLGRF